MKSVFAGIQHRYNFQFPRSHLVPTIRFIGSKGANFDDLTGQGLIDRLAELQSPDYDQREDFEIFRNINLFLQRVTGRQAAQIEIPHHREHVLVHMDQKVLPLKSLGTGIEEVIMLAAFCTINNDQIICIEEPETHLHPILQRKLVRYLNENTDNQYFIATHSASFIDTPGAAVFHVENDGVQTRIKNARLKRDKFDICAQLGYRASDILQANFVIWVEGPSDRIYLKHWIELASPDLAEGIHYSIMFYGGRLLSHLSMDDEEINEFISLRTLNQNLAIVIDSDKEKSQSRINKTKQRVCKEIDTRGGFAWVTKGREIENYVNPDVLHKAIREIYPNKYKEAVSTGQYDHALYFRLKKKKPDASTEIETNVDKVKVAKVVCREGVELDVLDLREQTETLVKQIRIANDLH